jgi:hypothetical protein
MAIPQSIQREHILKAIAQIKEAGTIPARRESKKFDLLYNRRRFPPKSVLYIANRFVAPKAKLRGSRGGKRTNDFLMSREFVIVNKDGTRIPPPTHRQDSSPKGSESKPKSGNRRISIKGLRISVRSLSDPCQLDFMVRTTEKVREAKKREAELVKAYQHWLQKELKFVDYQGLRCDAYEEERNNLIEAKSSGRREYIRMALGQLLDYAYLGRTKIDRPNMAILLQEQPHAKLLQWLSELKISVIWRRGRAFDDNADGQFLRRSDAGG